MKALRVLAATIVVSPLTMLSAGDKDAARLPHRLGGYISLAPSVTTPDFAISAYDGTIYTSDIVSEFGITIGSFWEMPFGNRLSGRLTLDIGFLGDGKTIDYRFYSKSYIPRQIAFMYDVHLYLDKSGRFYIFGGLGYYDRSITESLWGEAMRRYDISSGGCRSFGAGACISEHVALEFKRVTCDAPWTQVSLILSVPLR
jgi:hypothetical protein